MSTVKSFKYFQVGIYLGAYYFILFKAYADQDDMVRNFAVSQCILVAKIPWHSSALSWHAAPLRSCRRTACCLQLLLHFSLHLTSFATSLSRPPLPVLCINKRRSPWHAIAPTTSKKDSWTHLSIRLIYKTNIPKVIVHLFH